MQFPHPVKLDGETVKSTFIGVGPLQFATKLISAPPGGGQANGPSDQPSATDSGDQVAFRTAADNLVPNDRNRATDIVRASTLSGKIALISRTPGGAGVSGDSSEPVIGRTGQDLIFESNAGIDPNDKNCTGDIYHLDIPHNVQVLTSLDSSGAVPNAPFGTTAPCPQVVAPPAMNPSVSYYLNYATYEASWPFMDVPLGTRVFGHISNDQAAEMANSNPALHQVYLRYLGPR